MAEIETILETLQKALDNAEIDGTIYAEIRRPIVYYIINLLKEHEEVKPEKEHSGSGITWWNVCGNCKTAINPNDKYCHECGRPVLWEGR